MIQSSDCRRGLFARCRRRINIVGVILAAAVVAGCGDDSPSATLPALDPGTASPAFTSNRLPTISGKPIGEITAGSTFSFQPSASDPEGSSLTFSILNSPPWAAFDAATGRLLGTPSVGDVGTFSDITIMVSDGARRASLEPFSVKVVGTATGSFTLNWMPPTERSDGSVLSNLAGYKIYWGTARGDYPNSVTISNPGVSSYMIEQLAPGTYYLVMTAFDTAGLESAQSGVATKTVS